MGPAGGAMRRATAALCLLVGGGGVAAAATHDQPTEAVVDTAGVGDGTEDGAARRATTTSTSAVATTSTTAATTTTATTAPGPLTTAAPVEDEVLPQPPSGGGGGGGGGSSVPSRIGAMPAGGPETTVEEAGVYAFDVDTGGLVRLGDPGPFTVAGDRVLLAQGMAVRTVGLDGTPLGGYVLPPAAPVLPTTTAAGPEAITRIEAAPDGTAVVLSFVPVTTASGSTGASGMGRIVGPGGSLVRLDVPASQFEWTDDGSTIAFPSHEQVILVSAAGVTLRSVPSPSMYDVRWSPDGRWLAGSSNGAAVRLDVTTGGVEALGALRGGADLGPGGRLAGLAASDEVEWWRPVVVEPGGVTTLLSTWPGAMAPTWSRGGSRVAFLQSPDAPGSIGHGELDDVLQVVEPGGTPLRRVVPTAPLTVERGGILAPGDVVWVGDRHVVFAVVPG